MKQLLTERQASLNGPAGSSSKEGGGEWSGPSWRLAGLEEGGGVERRRRVEGVSRDPGRSHHET